jgi:tetratricopeptide (TPR) repeat protein
LNKNVKVIASLVRKAKKKLIQGKRDEALDLMRKAVNIDDNSGVLVQVIKVIGRKQAKTADQMEDVNEQPVQQGPEREPQAEETVQEEPLQEETRIEPEPEDSDSKVEEPERTTSMTVGDQLQKLFQASDTEYERGHQQKAIAYLKKARKLAPEDAEVTNRIQLLKTRIKSANLVMIARKKLQAGEAAKAVVLAREAFNMLPDATGLDDLLDDIQNYSPETGAEDELEMEDVVIDDDVDLDVPDEADAQDDDSAQSFITEIRHMVQSNSLEAAAQLAEKAFAIHPEDELLEEFVDNFRKLGLLE